MAIRFHRETPTDDIAFERAERQIEEQFPYAPASVRAAAAKEIVRRGDLSPQVVKAIDNGQYDFALKLIDQNKTDDDGYANKKWWETQTDTNSFVDDVLAAPNQIAPVSTSNASSAPQQSSPVASVPASRVAPEAMPDARGLQSPSQRNTSADAVPLGRHTPAQFADLVSAIDEVAHSAHPDNAFAAAPSPALWSASSVIDQPYDTWPRVAQFAQPRLVGNPFYEPAPAAVAGNPRFNFVGAQNAAPNRLAAAAPPESDGQGVASSGQSITGILSSLLGISPAEAAGVARRSKDPGFIKASPWSYNAGRTRKGRPINGIVIHNTYGATTAKSNIRYGNRKNTGAHFYVDRDGTVYRAAPDDRVVNHVIGLRTRLRAANKHGKKLSAQARRMGNLNTIGIEIVSYGPHLGPPTTRQLEATRQLVNHVAQKYKIPRKNVVKHADLDPARRGQTEGQRALEYIDAKGFGTKPARNSAAKVAQTLFGRGFSGSPERASSIIGARVPANMIARSRSPSVVASVPKDASSTTSFASAVARSRARHAQELNDAKFNEHIMALTHAEVGGQGRKSAVAVVETMFNRAAHRGTSLSKETTASYYEPMRTKAYRRALRAVRNSKALRNKYAGVIADVKAGSNVSKFALHNASAGVARRAKSKNPGLYTDIGGETFYTKRGAPGDPDERAFSRRMARVVQQSPVAIAAAPPVAASETAQAAAERAGRPFASQIADTPRSVASLDPAAPAPAPAPNAFAAAPTPQPVGTGFTGSPERTSQRAGAQALAPQSIGAGFASSPERASQRPGVQMTATPAAPAPSFARDTTPVSVVSAQDLAARQEQAAQAKRDNAFTTPAMERNTGYGTFGRTGGLSNTAISIGGRRGQFAGQPTAALAKAQAQPSYNPRDVAYADFTPRANASLSYSQDRLAEDRMMTAVDPVASNGFQSRSSAAAGSFRGAQEAGVGLGTIDDRALAPQGSAFGRTISDRDLANLSQPSRLGSFSNAFSAQANAQPAASQFSFGVGLSAPASNGFSNTPETAANHAASFSNAVAADLGNVNAANASVSPADISSLSNAANAFGSLGNDDSTFSNEATGIDQSDQSDSSSSADMSDASSGISGDGPSGDSSSGDFSGDTGFGDLSDSFSDGLSDTKDGTLGDPDDGEDGDW